MSKTADSSIFARKYGIMKPYLSKYYLTLLTYCLSELLLILLVACSNDATDEHKVVSPTTIGATGVKTAYYHLVGELAGEAVTFDLLQEENRAYADYGYFRGFYRYDRYGEPILLYGSLDSNGVLTLQEQGSYSQENHMLRGQWSKMSYTGRWESGDGQSDYPFTLHSVESGYIPLKPKAQIDSLTAFPAWKNSPGATFKAQWLVPHSDEAGTNTFLENVIAGGLVDRKLVEAKATSVEQVLQLDRNTFFEEYRREMLANFEEGLIDSANEDTHFRYSYAYDKSVVVYFNTADLLTLGFTDYIYTGGAHGMYGTDIKTYNLKAKKEVELDEIFFPGYEVALSKALAVSLRTKYGLDDNTPLSEVLFEDELRPNENFGLTDKGIFFVYAPYEIAAYALGEIQLFVPFENIEDYMQFGEQLNKDGE